MIGLVLPSELRGPFSSPFELFPEELWQLIFEALKDPQDLLNVMHATDEWYEMLEKTRTIFLFPKVLEILETRGLLTYPAEDFELTEKRAARREQYYIEAVNQNHEMIVKSGCRVGQRRRRSSEIEEERAERERRDVQEEEEFMEFWRNRKPFPPPIVQCRLVCKAWNRAVQNFLQFHPMHFLMHPDSFDLHSEPPSLIGVEKERLNLHCEFNSKGDIYKFMDKFEATHPSDQNPFLMREVVFNHTDDGELRTQQEFCNAITFPLEKYGRHLFHLVITTESTNLIPPATFYPLLQRWLYLTPNLKTLRLHNYHFQDSEDDLRDPQEEEVRLAAQIELTPLPKLEQLLYLETANFPALICQHLLHRNGHIEKLQNSLLYAPSYPNYDTYFRQATLYNLSELSLELNSRQELLQLETTLAGSGWRLKSLNINGFNEDSYEEWPEWRRLFHMVEESFGETLTHFWVHLPNPERLLDKRTILREYLNLRLNLPCLKQMRMRLPCLSSVDFLLSLNNSLEELSVLVLRKPISAYDKSREKIKFNGLFERMEKSSIWEILPKLRLLEVIILNKRNQLGEEEWSEDLGYLSTKYLYEKHMRSGNVSKLELDWSNFQWNVIFSKSQPHWPQLLKKGY